VAYGVGAGTVRRDTDVLESMSTSMEAMGSYLVLVFFAAQFVAVFNWTNLGLIVAVEGAAVLEALELGTVPLVVAFVALSAAINLAMGSASAKWAILAPVFVPMFMLLGYTPEFTQAAYRVGDSVTNVVSPMMSYFALIIAFFSLISINTGIFANFRHGFQQVGPGIVWSWLLVLAEQSLVALVMARLAVSFPLAGYGYQWSARLVSPHFGSFTGWLLLVQFLTGFPAVCSALASSLCAFVWPHGTAPMTVAWITALVMSSGGRLGMPRRRTPPHHRTARRHGRSTSDEPGNRGSRRRRLGAR
jgi:hypothetical protein